MISEQATFPFERDDARQKMLDDLVTRALAYHTSTEFLQLADFARHFPYMAPFNAMLLHVQNPGIRYALCARDWERRYDRRVNPGSRPYVILRTMGPVAFVFDLSDTTPRDPNADRVPDSISNPFPAKGDPPPAAIGNIIEACSRIKVGINERDLGTVVAGRVYRTPNSPHDFYLQLNARHTAVQKLGTIAHELGHVFCGHLGETVDGFWPDRSDLDQGTEEFEAEAVAYLVTLRMNLDIGSTQYLAGYLQENAPLPDYSLDAVLKAAGKIEEMADRRFRPRKK